MFGDMQKGNQSMIVFFMNIFRDDDNDQEDAGDGFGEL